MLKLSSQKYLEARARQFRIVRSVNVVGVSGLEPPIIESPVSEIQEDLPEVSEVPKVDQNAHPFFWKERGQRVPSEIRWIWNPQTGDMYVGTQSRHAGMTPSGTDWDSVLRGFYFPSNKTVAIRPFYWPNGTYDQWDSDHAELSADIQMIFVTAIQPTLEQQEPAVQFQLNIDNKWLQSTTGRYSW